ncbi:LCP family protein [Corynebacterium appendicis]|nr:LCP family protein [Corynebacterium appendicis]MDK8626393.1 LCP family protein [Corynebacterium appendicis]
MSTTPHSNDPRDNPGDFLVGKDGKLLVDRYGRPIRKRSASQPPETRRPERTVRETLQPRSSQPRSSQPRQYMPRDTQYDPRPHQPRRTPQREQHWEPQLELSPDRRVRGEQRRQRRQAPKPRARLRRPGCMGCLPTLLTLIVVLAVAGALFADARLTRVDAFPDDPIANTAGTNWLIVGSDSREGLTEKDIDRLGTGGDIGTGRTDTIMLMHIPNGGQATLVSIPRDSYVEIPGYGMDKINAAFAFGGPKLLAETVENATNLRIDHYAEVGMGGLASITDAAGGVELCPAEPIDDPLAQLNIQAGCQKMDGPTALGYVRTRATAMGDLDRVQRQREFVSALMKKALSPTVLLNPFRLVPLVLRGSSMLIVGDGDHVWHLARMAFALRGGVKTETVPIGTFMDTDVGSVLVWDDAAAEQLFAGLR